MDETAITVFCEQEAMLSILHRPDAERDRNTGIVIVVGGAQYRAGSHRMFVTLARKLTADGFTVLRFDRRGMGDSCGDDPGFDDCNEDIKAALDQLKREVPGLQSIYTMGLCDGATAAAICNFTDDEVAGYILINPWIRSAQTEAHILVSHYYKNRFMDRGFWRELFAGKVNLIQSIKEYFHYWRNSRRHRLVMPSLQTELFYRLKRSRKPVLFALSGEDITAQEFLAVSRLQPWKQWLQSEPSATLVQLEKADHTFSRPESMIQLGNLCRDWLITTSSV